jgi:hypothetical protein
MDMLELLNKGAQTVASLDDAACLQKAAEQFLGAYAIFEGSGVVAASSIAERVLGAAMMLRPELSRSDTGCTVIFDVNIASGTQLARAARVLRESGNADRLVGIALHSLVKWDPDAALGDLTQLVVAHGPADEVSSRECGDRGQNGLELALR